MRTKLFAIVLVAMLIALIPSSAFAADPDQAKTKATLILQGEEVLLGDVVDVLAAAIDPVTGAFLLNWPMDVYLYRPATATGDAAAFDWWFDAAFDDATQWMVGYPESDLRRQTWPGQSYSTSFGFYFARFMLPRDEAWYPCSYPCKWKCNGWNLLAGQYTEFHSPAELAFIYWDAAFADALYQMIYWPLFWPWDYDWVDPFRGFVNPYVFLPYDNTVFDATPFDTVHPLEVWLVEEVGYYAMAIWENKVMGYWWRPTDLEIQYPEDWPYICGYTWDLDMWLK